MDLEDIESGMPGGFGGGGVDPTQIFQMFFGGGGMPDMFSGGGYPRGGSFNAGDNPFFSAGGMPGMGGMGGPGGMKFSFKRR